MFCRNSFKAEPASFPRGERVANRPLGKEDGFRYSQTIAGTFTNHMASRGGIEPPPEAAAALSRNS